MEKPHSETVFGFWIYIMTDSMIFASLFVVFAIQRNQLAGGPSGKDLFDLKSTFEETALLLTSSLTCGLAMLGVHRKKSKEIIFWLTVTFLLGAGFVALEVNEFIKMIGENAGPDRSAFLTWLLVLLVQLIFVPHRLDEKLVHRLLAFSLFWHFLDIVWIGIFTFVYLNGVS